MRSGASGRSDCAVRVMREMRHAGDRVPSGISAGLRPSLSRSGRVLLYKVSSKEMAGLSANRPESLERNLGSGNGAGLSQAKSDSVGAGIASDHQPAPQLVSRVYADMPVDGET